MLYPRRIIDHRTPGATWDLARPIPLAIPYHTTLSTPSGSSANWNGQRPNAANPFAICSKSDAPRPHNRHLPHQVPAGPGSATRMRPAATSIGTGIVLWRMRCLSGSGIADWIGQGAAHQHRECRAFAGGAPRPPHAWFAAPGHHISRGRPAARAVIHASAYWSGESDGRRGVDHRFVHAHRRRADRAGLGLAERSATHSVRRGRTPGIG